MLQLHSNAACSCRPEAPARRRTHQFRTYTAIRTARPSVHAAAPTSEVGIVGLQGVCSPSTYIQHWQRATRPQLEALWGNILRTNNPERLLMGMDGLLMQLRSSRSLAVHIQQQHEDHHWVKAAAQVAADCKKYESYIHTNKTVAEKLCITHARLLLTVNCSMLDQRQQTQQQSSAESAASPQQPNVQDQQLLLQLCSALLAVVDDNLPSDSLDWLAALEVPDSNAEQLQQLRKKEHEIIAAIDDVVSTAVAVQLPMSASQLLSVQPTAQTAHTSADNATVAAAANAVSAGAEPDLLQSSERQCLQDNQQLFQQLKDQAQSAGEPQLMLITRSTLVRLLQQCDEAAVRQQLYTTVLLPKLQKATALLDQLAACRHYQAQLSGYSSYLDQTEQRVALASNSTSRSQDVDTSRDSSIVDFLLQLSEALKPLAQQEVDWVVSNGQQQQQQKQQQQYLYDHTQHDQVPASAIQQDHKHDWQQQNGPEMDHVQQQQQQQQHSEQPVQGFGPWDWDWLLHQAHAPFLQQLRDPTLRQHMHLNGVVCGFSNVLQQVLGVQLLLRPVGQHEVWGPHVHALMLVRQQQRQPQGSTGAVPQQLSTESSSLLQGVSATQWQCQQPQDTAATGGSSTLTVCSTSQAQTIELLGVVYLDIGGGYGTRMLRFTRQEPGQLDPVLAAAAAGCGSAVVAAGSRTTLAHNWDDLEPAAQQQLLACCADVPAVAVGISGSRILVQHQSETAAQSNMAQLQQQQPQRMVQGVGTANRSGNDNNAFSSSSSSSSSSTCSDDAVLVLSVPQLWEFGHEMGHALHLVLSSRQRACHLSGRYLPPSLLEVPSQLFEHLFTSPSILAQVCLHHESGQLLPQHLASAVTEYYGAKYRSALALAARAAAGLAEQMYGQFGEESSGSDIWRGSWEMLSGLPGPVAARGCLRELSVLPVMAAHNGTYHCYLISWIIAAQIAEHTFKPLLPLDASVNSACASTNGYSSVPSQEAAAAHTSAYQPAASCQPAHVSSSRLELQQAALDVMSMAAAMNKSEIVGKLAKACAVLGSAAKAGGGLLEGLLMPEGQLSPDLDVYLWNSPR